MGTKFTDIYDRFFGKITDDMYMELTPEDTIRDLQNLLIDAIPGFEFPRKNISDFTFKVEQIEKDKVMNEDFVLLEDDSTVTVERSSFNVELSSEEINILAILMMCAWLQRQITSIEITRMKYSGSDFKMTSQANHLSKLLTLLAETQRQSHHMQRLYKRRRHSDNGNYESNWSVLRDISALD